MVGKIILAAILLVIVLIIWKVWHTCKTGDANSFFGKIFAAPCHLLYSAS